jgi:hydroxyacylglutathione hydrolase
MPLLFETVFTGGLAQISYLVGDTSAGVAAVVDPRRDVQVYLDIARRAGVRITHAIETHIHADFASGVHELAARQPLQVAGGARGGYAFGLRRLEDGDAIVLGGVKLAVMHTPGHTPEHVCLLLHDARQGEAPFGILTGDTLFNLDVGRPDLLGKGQERRLAAELHRSLFGRILPLGDRIEVFPCHGAGSACGKSIGDRRQSTIGNERLYNPALQDRSEAEFIDWLLDAMPEPPRHYARLKKLNATGAPVLGSAPLPVPLSPGEFAKAAPHAAVVDIRSMLAFGGGHVPGALNIGLRDEFANWAGWMLPDDKPLLLVGEGVEDVHHAAAQLFRIGLDRTHGYLREGMNAWQEAALPLSRAPQWTVRELDERRHDPQVTVLDVRSDAEVAKGRIPGAKHLFLPHLEARIGELDPGRTVAVYCGSGYRASIGASILQRHGFRSVANVPGSWAAWTAAHKEVA